MNARSRAILMQKLDRTGTVSSIVESLVVPAFNGVVPNQPVAPLPRNGQATVPATFPTLLATTVAEPIGEPSECILLKNMFHPNTETYPDFDLDIKDDVQEECVKFGSLNHIYADKHCSNGSVYLRFESLVTVASCQRAMHMRWFAGRSISIAADSLSMIRDIRHMPTIVATIVSLKERLNDFNGAAGVLDSAVQWWKDAMTGDDKLRVILPEAASFKLNHGHEREAFDLYEELVNNNHGDTEALVGAETF